MKTFANTYASELDVELLKAEQERLNAGRGTGFNGMDYYEPRGRSKNARSNKSIVTPRGHRMVGDVLVTYDQLTIPTEKDDKDEEIRRLKNQVGILKENLIVVRMLATMNNHVEYVQIVNQTLEELEHEKDS